MGSGGHVRKRRRGSLSFGISIYYSKVIYIVYLKFYFNLSERFIFRRDSPVRSILIAV